MAGPDAGPLSGYAGLPLQRRFRQHHLLGFNMAYCDGSVRMVNYTINLTTHSHLCNRRDGQIIDFKKAF